MERKFKIMGIYLGMLFFVSILLILITSLSNRNFEPAYVTGETEEKQAGNFNLTMQESVTALTEENQNLNNKVQEQDKKILELEKKISENEKIIEEYHQKYNENAEKLYEVLILYANDDIKEAKEIFNMINRENLNIENQEIYDNILNKLK